MKRYFARLGLWGGSLLMVLAANLATALLGSDRAWTVTVANDQAQ